MDAEAATAAAMAAGTPGTPRAEVAAAVTAAAATRTATAGGATPSGQAAAAASANTVAAPRTPILGRLRSRVAKGRSAAASATRAALVSLSPNAFATASSNDNDDEEDESKKQKTSATREAAVHIPHSAGLMVSRKGGGVTKLRCGGRLKHSVEDGEGIIIVFELSVRPEFKAAQQAGGGGGDGVPLDDERYLPRMSGNTAWLKPFFASGDITFTNIPGIGQYDGPDGAYERWVETLIDDEGILAAIFEARKFGSSGVYWPRIEPTLRDPEKAGPFALWYAKLREKYIVHHGWFGMNSSGVHPPHNDGSYGKADFRLVCSWGNVGKKMHFTYCK